MEFSREYGKAPGETLEKDCRRERRTEDRAFVRGSVPGYDYACFSALFFGKFSQASSSTGRAAVSKTAGWGFESLLACQA